MFINFSFSETNVIKTQRVYEAMLAVDRGSYIQSSHAYVDSPQGIGYSVTISAPHMVKRKFINNENNIMTNFNNLKLV